GESGFLTGDGEMAGSHQLAPGGGGDALHFGDHGLWNGLQFLHEFGADVEDLAVFVDVAAGQLAKIVAGAKDIPGGGEDHGADLAIAADFIEPADEIEHQFERERVAALGAVQGDDGDGAFAGDLNIHSCSFALARNSFLRILPVAAPGDQLFGGGGVVGLEADEGFRHFPPFLVGEGDDGDFGNGGVIGQRLLDFNGGDVLAAGDDDVLHAVAHFDVAIGVDDGEVAGVEPAAVKGVRGGLGVVVIAEHDVVAAHQGLAHGLAIGGDIVHGVVGDPHVHAGDQVGHALAGFEEGALGQDLFPRTPFGENLQAGGTSTRLRGQVDQRSLARLWGSIASAAILRVPEGYPSTQSTTATVPANPTGA